MKGSQRSNKFSFVVFVEFLLANMAGIIGVSHVYKVIGQVTNFSRIRVFFSLLSFFHHIFEHSLNLSLGEEPTLVGVKVIEI